MPSSSSPSPSPSSSSSTTARVSKQFKLTTTFFFLIFSLLFRLLKYLISAAMEDLFASTSATFDDANADDDDNDLLLFSHPRRRRRLLDYSPSSLRHDRIFFVPLRWWKDADLSKNVTGGVLFTALTSSDDDGEVSRSSDIVLRLRKQCADRDDSPRNDLNGLDEMDHGEGVSGREYALISESMWLKALKWHSDYYSSRSNKDKGCSFPAEGYNKHEVFSLQVRLLAVHVPKSLLVKISPIDNSLLCYERACQIFDEECSPVYILDLCGQMTQFYEEDGAMLLNGNLDQANEEVLLELQVYGFSDFGERKDVIEKVIAERDGFRNKENGVAEGDEPSLALESCDRGCNKTGLLGLTGLLNLGNTCFMNSALQCLAHTPELVDYFLGDYKKEINYGNPLGMNGELALTFGDLLRKLWVPGREFVAPRLFKSTLENFAPQFSGYNQHDSQELLAFLLDGLHEDLNRVKQKPYVEVRDAVGRSDEVVADEYWQNHLARNDSIIVDVCHGQYRSTLVCPICKRVSVTFDPLMYLSLPLPSTTMRTMTITIISADGSTQPSSTTVTVPKCGTCEDLVRALSTSCSLRCDETLLVAEVYNNVIIQFFEDPSDSLALIRDADQLVAYRLPKGSDTCQLVVFMQEHGERYVAYGKERLSWKLFGIPLVARISNLAHGSQIRDEFAKLITPFLNKDIDDYDVIESSDIEPAKTEASMSSSDESVNFDDEACADLHAGSDFQFYFTDNRGSTRGRGIKLTRHLSETCGIDKLNVLVCWPEDLVREYDTSYLSSLPKVFKPEYPLKLPESISLYKCLEGFLKDEPLGLDDMWYCPTCKQHQQANKKLDLWRLPEILVIHLKRFSYSRFMTNKLETYVDFPINELDLTEFLAHKNSQQSDRYRLYAIINHYGGLGGGHYTALVYYGSRWYEFNDSIVKPVREEDVKTSAAYVLFYQRISAM